MASTERRSEPSSNSSSRPRSLLRMHRGSLNRTLAPRRGPSSTKPISFATWNTRALLCGGPLKRKKKSRVHVAGAELHCSARDAGGPWL
eukprot:5336445-Pyramimonas_sp.AAC.1